MPAGSLGFIEIYDARLAPVGWTEVDFDDSDWEYAECLRVAGRNFAGDVIPFPVMIPSDIPRLIEVPRWAEAVVRVAEVTNATTDTNAIAPLFEQELLADLRACSVIDAEHLLHDDGITTITTSGTRGVSLVLDFGETQPGRVQFDLEVPPGRLLTSPTVNACTRTDESTCIRASPVSMYGPLTV
ncbi:MAG: hypothetical protein IPK17_35930 [Chloroflexi bacterium]|uniref:hypothetical protein n=1 Tax=Candidatus Flexifilum breve TaxID=3140694 RepID=UPI003134D7DF|nr:hypothetical protein [Chloroflexota bacterium]